MLVTDDKKLFERAKFLRDHGRQPGSYFTEELYTNICLLMFRQH